MNHKENTPGKGKKRVLAAASVGGHWVQLMRLARQLDDSCDMVYMSTHPRCATMVQGHDFYCLCDFSRWNWYRLFPALAHAMSVVRRVKPDCVLTTGAAPGFVAILAGWMLGVETIWVDSIANVEHLSLCGRMAAKFATHVLTQWPELATGNVTYAGSVLNV